MTESSYRKEFSEEKLPFDPESSRKIDPDLYWKNKEAEQSHGFRGWAFGAGMVVLVGVSIVWAVVMFQRPPDYVQPAAFYVWGWRASLCSVVLIVVSLGLFRFAILCYGHHRASQKESAISDSAVGVLGKVVETVGKNLQHTTAG